MEAKRWNERLKLVMTALNTTAIGLLGLSVIAPMLARLAAYNASPPLDRLDEKLRTLGIEQSFSITDGVVWQAALAALFLHLLAHIVVSFMDKED